jgi:hypothetical protein
MLQNFYEPEKLLARAKEWRIEARAATTPEMRAFCLQEAIRCETVVRQSLETPAVRDDGPAPDARSSPAIRRGLGMTTTRRKAGTIRVTSDRR